VAAIGPLLVILGNVISVIGTIMTLAPALGGVIAALSGPVGIVVAAIAAAIAIGVLLYKNWDTIKEKAAELGAAIKEKWEQIKTATSQKWSEIKTNTSQKWSDIKTTVSEKAQSIKESVNDKFSSMKQSISQKFSAIKTGIKEKMDAAKDAVKNAIDKIKGFFNFEWSLPKLKMPHFSISGKFSLDPPSVPHLSVEWYKKAMNNGMILDGPTIFGMKDGHLLGGGEAGSEAVVGTDSLMKMIQAAVDAGSRTSHGDLNVYVTSYGTDAASIADEIGAAVNRKLRMSGSW
jgi:hypothetical protein